MQHSDLFEFASSYWWLIFPLGWGLLAMLQTWLRHRQARAMIDLLKIYVDRGEDPPDALLNAILPQAPSVQRSFEPLQFWLCSLLLSSGAIGFAALAWLRTRQGDSDSANAVFIAILLGAAAAACAAFAAILHSRRFDPGAP